MEDGGQALIVDVDPENETNGDGMFFTRIQSWAEGGSVESHTLFNSLRGKRIRVTVETLD